MGSSGPPDRAVTAAATTEATADGPRATGTKSLEDRGVSETSRGTASSSSSSSAPGSVQSFDFAVDVLPEDWLGVDILAEAESHPVGTPVKEEKVLLGEMMLQVMKNWEQTELLKYPKPKESGIGPVSRPSQTKVLIGGDKYTPSEFRSCSPTTFRALMEALQNTLPDGRDLETAKSVSILYKKWQCSNDVYGSLPLVERKGAVDVIANTPGLGRELVFGTEITNVSQLAPGDILQVWSRSLEKEKDKEGKPIMRAGKVVTQERWGGHSSIVVTTTKGLWTISATTPAGEKAIKVQPKKLYAAAIWRMIRGQPHPPVGIQAVYAARTTHQVRAWT